MAPFINRWLLAEEHKIHVRQGQYEFGVTYELIRQQGPLTDMLEIGSFRGGSALVLAGLLTPSSRIVLIDDCSRGAGAMADLQRAIGLLEREGFTIHLVRGLSQRPETRQMVADIMGNNVVGLCHIDGGHESHVVQQDFSEYVNRYLDSQSTSFAIFHDVVAAGGVCHAWKQICARVKNTPEWQTYVIGGTAWQNTRLTRDNPDFWATGIGLIRRGAAYPPPRSPSTGATTPTLAPPTS